MPVHKTRAASPRRSQPKQENSKGGNHTSESGAPRFLVFWTAALVFVGLASAVIAYLQWDILRGHLGEMKTTSKLTERSVEAFERYARTAEKHLEFAQRTEDQTATAVRNQERAYIYIESVEVRNLGNWTPGFIGSVGPNLGPIDARVRIKNSGLTQANVKMWATAGVVGIPLRNFPSINTAVPAIEFTVIPGGEIPRIIRTSRAITAEEKARVISGRAGFYVYGEMRFADANKQNRVCSFRWYYQGDGSAPGDPVELTAAQGNNKCDR